MRDNHSIPHGVVYPGMAVALLRPGVGRQQAPGPGGDVVGPDIIEETSRLPTEYNKPAPQAIKYQGVAETLRRSRTGSNGCPRSEIQGKGPQVVPREARVASKEENLAGEGIIGHHAIDPRLRGEPERWQSIVNKRLSIGRRTRQHDRNKNPCPHVFLILGGRQPIPSGKTLPIGNTKIE